MYNLPIVPLVERKHMTIRSFIEDNAKLVALVTEIAAEKDAITDLDSLVRLALRKVQCASDQFEYIKLEDFQYVMRCLWRFALLPSSVKQSMQFEHFWTAVLAELKTLDSLHNIALCNNEIQITVRDIQSQPLAV